MPTIAAWMLLLLYPAFSVLSWRAKLTKWNQQLKGGLVGVLIVPYWLAVNGQPSWPEMLSLVVYIALPTLLLRWSARQSSGTQLGLCADGYGGRGGLWLGLAADEKSNCGGYHAYAR